MIRISASQVAWKSLIGPFCSPIITCYYNYYMFILLHVVIIYQFMYSVMVFEFKDSEGWRFGVGI